MKRGLLLFFAFLLFSFYSYSDDFILHKFEKKYKEHKIQFIKNNNGEAEYIVYFNQPINHDSLDLGFFSQKVYLTYRSSSLPTVVITDGYNVDHNYRSELLDLFPANQLIIEYRYFGESKPPRECGFGHLTAMQGARDHEAVISLFKGFFSGKFLTTGISKGGQMAFIHRALFPESVDLTVTYVAPYNFEREDRRINDFFESVGSDKERRYILNFQKNALMRREEILPLLEYEVSRRGLEFNMSLEKIFEIAILEYEFSFWQWGSKIDNDDYSTIEAEKILYKLFYPNVIGYLSKDKMEYYVPFFYQAYTELGFYSYDTYNLTGYLKEFAERYISSSFMLYPLGVDLIFDNSEILHIHEMFRKNDPATIHIVGGIDPWSATMPNVEGLENSLVIKDPRGSHLVRINNMPIDLKNKLLLFLKKELEIY